MANKPVWKNKISMIITESDLQRTCTDYLDILVAQDKVRYCVVPDGEFRRRGKGYCPDIIVFVKRKYEKAVEMMGMYVVQIREIAIFTFELKTPRGAGRLTKKQADFNNWLGNYTNTHTTTNDFDEFKSIIDEALN